MPDSSAASMPCTRCGATPETGQGEDCPECQGVVGPINVGSEKPTEADIARGEELARELPEVPS